nr:reverse transcriptase domain-containing protein [Tanacetum cinerariifolium]
MNVFAWEPANMTGIPRRIIEHTLNVNPTIEPIVQKRRVLAFDRTHVVSKEAKEWVNAGIVRPGNNQGRNQFFQGASHGANPPPAYQAPAYQASGYQALVHQPTIPQPNTVTNPKEDLKGITTRSGNAYQGPTIPTTSSSSPKVVERETEVTKDTVPPTNNGSTKDVQPLSVQVETPVPNFEPVVALVAKPVVSPVSAPKPNQKQAIPHPSRLHDQKLHDKANDQKEKNFANL